MPNPLRDGPPRDADLERAFLGCLLQDPLALEEVRHVEPDDLYWSSHRELFVALVELEAAGRFGEGVSVLLEVSHHLERKGVLRQLGGDVFLGEVYDAIPTATNTTWYAARVKEYALRRRIAAAGLQVSQEAYTVRPEDGAPQLVERAELVLAQACDVKLAADSRPVARVGDDVIAAMDAARQEGPPGVPSGFGDLDEIVGAFMPGWLVIVAGRPGHGKTSLALSMTRRMCRSGRRVLFVSLEMGSPELTRILLGGMAGVNPRAMLTGFVGEQERNAILEARAELDSWGLRLNDEVATLAELRSAIYREAKRRKVELVVVDYLQLLTDSGGKDHESRQVEVATISRTLKLLAKRLEIPVVALAQLNRMVEHRRDKRPMASDLKESGALEQDADLILGVYRPELWDPDDESLTGTAYVGVLKNRHGPVGNVELLFDRGVFTDAAAGWLPRKARA